MSDATTTRGRSQHGAMIRWPWHLVEFDVFLLERWPQRSARVEHPRELVWSPLLWFHDRHDQGRPCVDGHR